MPCRPLVRLAAIALPAVLSGLVAVAQPPAAEPPPRTTIPFEQEVPDAPKPPYKRIEVEDDLPDLAAATGAYYVRLADVSRAATAAKNPTLKAFLQAHVVAFDRVTEAAPRNKPRPQFRATPVPLLWGSVVYPDEFGAVPLDDQNHPGDVRTLARGQVVKVDPFERLAVLAVNKLLADSAEKDPPPPADKLAAADRLLSEVLLFHEKARELNRRKGKVWEPVKAEVNDKLTEVRVARVRQAVADKDWATVRGLGGRLADRYRNQPKVLEVVYAARLAEAEVGLQSDRVSDLERVKALLTEYDARFPASTDPTAARLRKLVADRAAKILADANRLAFQNPTEARNLLRTAESLDPDNPTLRQQQQNLLKSGYPVLFVGTRRLPERMSPGTARWDSETQAAELMFEGLCEAVPEDGPVGVRFVPALATERPVVGAGVRDFALVGSAEWAGPDRGLLDPADLSGTVDLLRNKPDTWPADPVGWVKEVAPGDPGRVRIRFGRGHPDPRELLTFKVLPARWLTAKGKQADDVEFGRQPFGTGPFRLSPAYRPPGPGSPSASEVVFLSNPAFARRPGKAGQPAIKEIHFKDLSRAGDPVELFKGPVPLLHLLPDVPTADLAKYAGPGLGGKVQVVTEAAPRRVHLLAVNHRRPSLQSVDLRRGLTHAIDRDTVLTEVFRGGRPEFHRPLSGPFPPASWAAAKPLGLTAPPLFNRDLGAAKLRAYRDAGGNGTLRLSFAADDPQARAACERIRADVEAAGGGAAGNGVTLELEPLAPADLYRQVRDEHRFDLAYLPFDYRDDWYPLDLAALLDPTAAGPGGRNYLGAFTPGTDASKEGAELARLLAEVRAYRDPAKLAALAHDIHRRFNDAVPFVPLWHLDRHMVVSTALKVVLDGRAEEVPPRLLDQTTLFNSVGRWRLE